MVTDANGCTSTATVTVNVTPIECTDPYLPNAFSPNGDGDNDVLKIYSKVPQCIKDLKLVIFNRYGEMIYETYDPAFEWNGVYNRGILAGTSEAGTEVFVYYLQATIFPNKKINKKGNISLVR
jgi:gliding motility-associated-like protein